MPWKAKHPCAYLGCNRLADGRYCDEHRKEVDSEYNKFCRAPNVGRKYGRAWHRIRKIYAMEHPYCERCFKEGRMTLVDEVHHIVPVSQGGTNIKCCYQERRQFE